ncbi:hypothetical protein DYB32_000693 [Aphanomyces invadans]|uniref:Uncharacterized protein n=1 Tax=Aphanomyces invadans TaxID=157072 RepID=A0A418B970_9STRA|nr:hypothetical protein DYB32_000693 [Aphanomyces invadans]
MSDKPATAPHTDHVVAPDASVTAPEEGPTSAIAASDDIRAAIDDTNDAAARAVEGANDTTDVVLEEGPVSAARASNQDDVSTTAPRPHELSIAIPDDLEACMNDCTSPGHDAQLAGYPPDCGTKRVKYLSYAKCRRDRGLTHPMCYSQTEKDRMGHAVPKTYPVIATDFGAHSFHTLPTDSHVLSKYGIGISLYFKFLKVMSWLFLIMFIISLPSMAIYVICGSGSTDAIKLQLQKNPLAILGMTSMGHLGESEKVCAQAKYGETLTLTCPYGEIGRIEASYSLHDSQGTCSCPTAYQTSSNGVCRGTVDTATSSCPSSGAPCYLGAFPSAGDSCCGYTKDPVTGAGEFPELAVKSAPGCSSPSVVPILNGLCLGQQSCSLAVDDSELYLWKVDKTYNTVCTDRSSPLFCQARLSDQMATATCPNATRGDRGIIAQAQCLTTKIDVSDSWAFKIMGWNEVTLKAHLETVLSAKPPVYKDSVKAIRVADVNFGLTNAMQISLMRKRGEVAAKLDVALQRIAKFKKLQPGQKPGNSHEMDAKTFDKRMEKLLKASNALGDQFTNYDKRLDEWEKKNKGKGLVAVTAYITFEEEEGYLRCLREYPNLGLLHRLFQPYHKRFLKKRMFIQTAPDPTDIIWENLDYTAMNRGFRVVVVNILALSLLCLSFIIIYAAKVKKNELTQKYGAPVSCPDGGVTAWDVVQEQTSNSGDQTMVMCYCKAALLRTSLKDAMNINFVDHRTGTSAKYCDSWGTQYLEIQALMVASVLIVVVINACLTPVLRYLVLKQKSHTRSGVVVATVTKIFIAQFFNTALIVLLLNANMDDVMDNSAGASINGIKIFTGKYSDFSVSWYNDVGISLMLTMIINMVSPHAGVFITYVVLEIKRFADRSFSFDWTITHQETQRDLEALYRGPEFDLASRYSVVINTIFITLLFSSGMPLMLLIGLFSMIITYWTDKFSTVTLPVLANEAMLTHLSLAFLRVVRSPPQYDGKIAGAAGSLLPWAILLHTLFGIWMYSNTQIFDKMTTQLSALGSLNAELERGGRIVARAITMPSEVMFGLLVAIAALALLRVIVFRYFASALRSVFPICVRMLKKEKRPRNLPNYFDAIPTHVLKESLATKTLKPHLRESYNAALVRRGMSSSLEEADTAPHSGVVLEGCHSYDIMVNAYYKDAFGGGAFHRSL